MKISNKVHKRCIVCDERKKRTRLFICSNKCFVRLKTSIINNAIRKNFLETIYFKL